MLDTIPIHDPNLIPYENENYEIALNNFVLFTTIDD